MNNLNYLLYQHNFLFFINNFFIFILNPQPNIKYKFYFINNNYLLQIFNNNNNIKPLNIFLKIIDLNNNCYYYNIYKNINNLIFLNDIPNLTLNHKHKDNYHINNSILKNINPNFDYNLYNNNLFNIELNNNNILFLKYNWYYFGQFNKFQYFKYIIYKNKLLFLNLFNTINYNLTYNINKKYSLVFIDDRYDEIFIYILITFLYSIDNNWNLNIFSTIENKNFYDECLTKHNIQYKFNSIYKFNNVNDYSNLLKSFHFWNNFIEDYILIFQYDSLAFNKFNYQFLNYNYIGAQWPIHIQQIKNIFNGNGGTSLRNVQVMKDITLKYNYKNNDLCTPEDIYFSKYLFNEKKLMNNPNICNDFSFENVLNNNSIYGHAIYESISHDNLENFILNKIKYLLI